MKYIGIHSSIIGGFIQPIIHAHSLKATAVAFFVKNQRQWRDPYLTTEIIDNFYTICKKYHFTSAQILPHSSYLINLSHPDSYLIWKSREAFIKEIKCCHQLKLNKINFHPGNHLFKLTIKECIERVAQSINIALDRTEGVTLVIENTAGQGSSIGYDFHHIAEIISRIEDKSRIGVCIDTCHAFSSGYDLRNIASCNDTFTNFNKIIGFKYLRGIHANDSKTYFNSRIDRHENIGYGSIGKIVFSWIMKNNNFDKIPIILETRDSSMWQQEISWLHKQNS